MDDVYSHALYSSVIQQAFQGASYSFKLEQRGLVGGEPDFLGGREQRFLNYRAGDLVRNNAVAKTAKQEYCKMLNGLKVEWINSAGSKKGETHQEMQDYWEEFAENPNLDGYGNFLTTQQGWNSSIFQHGEVFCRRLIQRRKGITVPLVIQNIPANYLDPLWAGTDPLHTRNGITFQNGKPLIYNFDARPVGWSFGFYSKDTYNTIMAPTFYKIQVPAEEVAHIFHRESEGQWRGINNFASMMLLLYNIEDLFQAVAQKQINAQSLTWIIKEMGTVGALTPIGTAVGVTAKDEQGRVRNEIVMKANAGSVQHLNKNQDIQQLEGSGIGTNLIDFIKLQLQIVATNAGLPYESFGDLSNVNMSTMQQIAVNQRQTAEFIYQMYTIPLGIKRVTTWFQELAPLYGSKRVARACPVVRYPSRPSLNPMRDAQVDLIELQSHLNTYSNVLAKRNLTPEEFAADKELLKELGLSFTPPTQTESLKNPSPKPNSNTKG